MGFWNDARDIGLGVLDVVGQGVTALTKAAREPKETNESEIKALAKTKGAVPTEKASEDPKSLFWDPFAIINQLGYKDRPTRMTYGTLNAMVWKCPVVHLVIQQRINQVASFSQAVQDRFQLGYRIKLRDTQKKPTRVELKWARDMEGVLETTGVSDNPAGRIPMESFLRQTIFDSLVYDQYAWEIIPNRKGQPADWHVVDGASMRIADSSKQHVSEDETDEIRYVQIYDDVVYQEYTQEEMCFGIRNPRPAIKQAGYGVSELEMLIPAITSLLYSWEFNQKFFSQGFMGRGVLNFKGINRRNLLDFRRHWHQLTTGVKNAWRTPVTSAEGVEWINMNPSARDMEFNAWMDFLIKVVCAAYQMDPLEINFQYGNVGQRQTLSEGNNKEKLTESKERGLRPLLRSVASNINRHIVWKINPEFEFEFVGLDSLTRQERAELSAKQVATYMTVDEVRAAEDLPPLPDGKGAIILNPVWFQNLQMQMQVSMGEEEGNENADEAAAAVNEDEDMDNDEIIDAEFSEMFGDDATGNQATKSLNPARPVKGLLPAPKRWEIVIEKERKS